MEPRAPPDDPRRGGRSSCIPALAGARAHLGLPVLRLPDRRRPPRAHRAGRGRALRRGLRQRARGRRARRGGRPRAPACASRRRQRRRVRRPRRRTSSTRPGVWADRIRPEELHDEAEVPRIRPSRGTHITLRHDDLPLKAGAIVPAAGGRSIFALPWLGAYAARHDRQRLRAATSTTSRPPRRTSTTCSTPPTSTSARSWRPADLTGAYAGVRPLISTGDPKKSVDISRKAELYETSSGMVTITGGKLTTWRRMAKMAVDRLVEREARDAPCRTHEIPLGATVAVEDLPRVEGVPEDGLRRAGRPLRPCRPRRARRRRASAASSRSRSSPTCPTCWPRSSTPRAASRRARVGDVLLRRTRLGLLAARELGAGGAVATRVAARPGPSWAGTSGRRARPSRPGAPRPRAEGVVAES